MRCQFRVEGSFLPSVIASSKCYCLVMVFYKRNGLFSSLTKNCLITLRVKSEAVNTNFHNKSRLDWKGGD